MTPISADGLLRGLRYRRFVIMVGVTIMIASQILPLWVQSQVLTISGPKVEFNQTRTYWIDARVTPPIRSGSRILVTLTTMKPGSAALLIFPSTSDGDMKGPSLLAEVLEPEASISSWNLTAPQDANYMLVVTSWNSTYVLRVESTWSSFHETKTVLLFGFAIAFGGILLEYYQRILTAEKKKWDPLSSVRTGRYRKRIQRSR